VVSADGEVKDIGFIAGNLFNVYDIPTKIVIIVVPDDALVNMTENHQSALKTRERVTTVCTSEYAAWYNTVVFTHLVRSPDKLASFRKLKIEGGLQQNEVEEVHCPHDCRDSLFPLNDERKENDNSASTDDKQR